MSQTLNSSIDTPILSKRGSFVVPDPRISCKMASPPRPPLLPLRCVSRWFKECPLTKLANWIIAYIYGEPKCHVFKSSLAEKEQFWNPILPDIHCPSTDTSHYISLLPEVCRSVVFFPMGKSVVIIILTLVFRFYLSFLRL